MTAISVVKLRFPEESGQLDTILSEIGSRRELSFEIETSSVSQEAATVLTLNQTGILFACIRSKEDLAELLMFLKRDSRILAKIKWKCFVFEAYQRQVLRHSLEPLGVRDIFPLSEGFSPLKNHVEAFLEATLRSEEATPKPEAIQWAPALNLEADCWLVDDLSQCRRVLKSWLIPLLGPSTQIGRWERVRRGVWAFEINKNQRDLFGAGEGKWFVEASVMPKLIWQDKRWAIQGEQMQLYYESAGTKYFKIQSTASGVMVAKNSLHAEMKKDLILESFEEKFVFSVEPKKKSEDNNLKTTRIHEMFSDASPEEDETEEERRPGASPGESDEARTRRNREPKPQAADALGPLTGKLKKHDVQSAEDEVPLPEKSAREIAQGAEQKHSPTEEEELAKSKSQGPAQKRHPLFSHRRNAEVSADSGKRKKEELESKRREALERRKKRKSTPAARLSTLMIGSSRKKSPVASSDKEVNPAEGLPDADAPVENDSLQNELSVDPASPEESSGASEELKGLEELFTFYFDSGKYAEAYEVGWKIIFHFDLNEALSCRVLRLLFMLKKYDDVLALYHQFSTSEDLGPELRTHLGAALFLIGRQHLKSGEEQTGVACFDAIAESYDLFPKILKNAVLTFLELGRQEEAEIFFELIDEDRDRSLCIEAGALSAMTDIDEFVTAARALQLGQSDEYLRKFLLTKLNNFGLSDEEASQRLETAP